MAVGAGAFLKAVVGFAAVAESASIGYKLAVLGGKLLLVAGASAVVSSKTRPLQSTPVRNALIHGTTEPHYIVYGEAAVGGMLVYANTEHVQGTTNGHDLHILQHVCAREIEDVRDLWIEADKINNADIDWSGTGEVTAGKYAPANLNPNHPAVTVWKKLGTDTQTVHTELLNAYADWTGSHRGRGHASVLWRVRLSKESQELFPGAPGNLRALVRGVKVYDASQDSTNGGSGAQRFADKATWAWSSNPVWCAIDYLTQYFDVPFSRVDWTHAITQAATCDATVSVPGGTEARYSCNGVISLNATFEDTLRRILSCCLGRPSVVGGLWRINVGGYEAPTVSFNEDNIVGTVRLSKVPGKSRFNTVRATYTDAANGYRDAEAPEVTNATYISEDGAPLAVSRSMPMVATGYQAQRLAITENNVARDDDILEMSLGWEGLQLAPRTRCFITYAPFELDDDIFRVVAMKVVGGETPVVVSLRRDSAAAWATPLVGEYSTVNAAGVITPGSQKPLPPTGLAAVGVEGGVSLTWTNPALESETDYILVEASPDSDPANAVEVWRGNAEQFTHDDPAIFGSGAASRYYRVSAFYRNRQSDYDPAASDTTLSVMATSLATSGGGASVNADNFSESVVSSLNTSYVWQGGLLTFAIYITRTGFALTSAPLSQRTVTFTIEGTTHISELVDIDIGLIGPPEWEEDTTYANTVTINPAAIGKSIGDPVAFVLSGMSNTSGNVVVSYRVDAQEVY